MITREQLKSAVEIFLTTRDNTFLYGMRQAEGYKLRLLWVDKKIERLRYTDDLPQAISELPVTEEGARLLIPESAYDDFHIRLKQICEANGIDIQANRIITPKLYSRLVRHFGPKKILGRAGKIDHGRLVDCNKIKFV